MAVKYWSGQPALYEFDYDTGTHAPIVGETINVDIAAEETAVVHSWTVASGAWGTSNAAGKMWVYSCSADFITNLENNDNIDDASDNQICITTGGVTLKTGDWTVPGNWGEGEDPSVPVADDEIIFDSAFTESADTNVAVGNTGGIDFDLIHIKTGYSGDIGAAGSPLHTSADKIIIEGTGTYYIECSEDATGKDQTLPLVITNNRDCTVYLTSNENSGSWCCEFTDLFIVAGTIYIGNNGSANVATAVQTLRISPYKSSRATVMIAIDCVRTKATAYNMSIYMSDGECISDSAINVLEIYDGDFTYGTDLGASPETDLNITTLRIYDGTLNWHPDDSGDDAYIGTAYLFGGLVDASSATNANRTKTLGDGSAGHDIMVFENASLNLANGRSNISPTGSSQLWNFGGELTLDNNTQYAWLYNKP